jgi:glutamyl-tRNA synthetase
MEKSPEVRVRMAPSPTGYLHIGSARTTLFNWLFARSKGGTFILRIEDTDQERSTKEFEDDILNGLKWLGLGWDEFYRQSERKEIYKIQLHKLLDEKKAFWCYHSHEELEDERKRQITNKEPQRHICDYKKIDAPSIDGRVGIIRLAVDVNSTRTIRFEDEIRGSIEQEERLLGDISIAKDLDNPLYNFAVVVDDIDMRISHVIRGEDHISNTFKQILVYESFGAKIPAFAHLPLILGTDRSKMSKRNSNTALDEYKKDYLPQSIMNFIAFLGYTYSKEIISMEEMISEFDIKKTHKSGAVWNVDELDWINAQYIKNMPADEFIKTVGIDAIPETAVSLITERLDKLTDVAVYDFFWNEPKYDPTLLIWKNCSTDDAIRSLKNVMSIISKHDFDIKEGRVALRLLLDDAGKIENNRGLIYWPLRVALSGKDKSPDPVEIAYVLGKDKTMERISTAIKILS